MSKPHVPADDDWTLALEQHLSNWHQRNSVSNMNNFGNVYKSVVYDFDKVIIKFALRLHAGNVKQSAAWLGLSIGTVRTRINQLGINLAEFRPQRGQPSAPNAAGES